MGRPKSTTTNNTPEQDLVTFIVKLPLTLRKTVKMLAAREGITINDFFIRAAEKEVADVIQSTKG